MRLLMLTVDWQPIEGGIATLCEGLASALGRRGHELRVLAPRVRGTIPGRERSWPGVQVERWPGYHLGALRWLPFSLDAARALGGHDAVLAMNPAYGGLVSWLGRLAGGPPYLAWAYGFELLKARGTPLAPLYRRLFEGARAAIAISGHTRDLLLSQGVAAPAIQIVYPGVDPPPAPAPASERAREALGLGRGPVILSVGRLIARKGHLELLDAVAQVLRRRPDVLWAVVGRGPLAGAIRERARALGIESRVRLLGYLDPDRLEQAWAASTLFALLPTESSADVEGFGIVFLEAGARLLPVVGARSGGVSEAVEDGVTGVLVAPGDAAAAAAAILQLLEQPGRARSMAEAGRRKAASLSWDRAAQAVEALIS